MGITTKEVAYLAAVRLRGVNFARTLMIGRQHLYTNAAGILQGVAEVDASMTSLDDATRIADSGGGFAEPLMEHFGATAVHSLDASAFEGGTHVHDMNDPLPAEMRAQYSLVLDGGSLEHIFNAPQALANCMSAVEVGGHLVTFTTCNSYVGHGFYQFSPEFFFRALTQDNGFKISHVLIRSLHRWGRWRIVKDPAVAGRRVELATAWPTLVYVLARRISDVPIMSAWPQQSDYLIEWNTGQRSTAERLSGRLPRRLRRIGRVTEMMAGVGAAGDFEPISLRFLPRS